MLTALSRWLDSATRAMSSFSPLKPASKRGIRAKPWTRSNAFAAQWRPLTAASRGPARFWIKRTNTLSSFILFVHDTHTLATWYSTFATQRDRNAYIHTLASGRHPSVPIIRVPLGTHTPIG